MSELDSPSVAYVLYERVVMWKKPGGTHHVDFLKRGDKVIIIQGWKYVDRTWKDKRYIKVSNGSKIGYVLAAALTSIEESIPKKEGTSHESYNYSS